MPKKSKTIKAWVIKVKKGGVVCLLIEQWFKQYMIFDNKYQANTIRKTFGDPSNYEVVPCEIKILIKKKQ